MKLAVPLIINWLVRWLTLSFDYKDLSSFISNSYEYENSYLPYSELSAFEEKHKQLQSNSRKLLTELLTHVPFHEIESFSPQICNLIVDNKNVLDESYSSQVSYLEDILERKSADSLPFGMHVCNMLKALLALEQSGGYRLFRQFLQNRDNRPADAQSYSSPASTSSSSSNTAPKSNKIRNLLEKLERRTLSGAPDLPDIVSALRSDYYHDFNLFMDSLGNLGSQLKSFPVPERNGQLRRSLEKYNQILFYRLLRDKKFDPPYYRIKNDDLLFHQFQLRHSSSPLQRLLSDPYRLLSMSLHYPLQYSNENCFRIVSFHVQECEVLPSKDRCPYLVTVELLEQAGVSCAQDELFSSGYEEEIFSLPSSAAASEIAASPSPSTPPHRAIADRYQHRGPPRLQLRPPEASITPPVPDAASSPPPALVAGPMRPRRFPQRRLPPYVKGSSEGAPPRLLPSEECDCLLEDQPEETQHRHQLDTNQRHLDDFLPTNPIDVDQLPPSDLSSPLFSAASSETERDEDELDVLKSLIDLDPPGSAALAADLSQREDEESKALANLFGTTVEDDKSSARRSDLSNIRGGQSPALPSVPLSSTPFPPGYVRLSKGKRNRSPSSPAAAVSSSSSSISSATDTENPLQDTSVPTTPSSSSSSSSSPPPSPAFPTDERHHRHPLQTESWKEKKQRIKEFSPFGRLRGWNLASFIVKANDKNILKEVLAMQLIRFFQSVFAKENLDIFLKSYRIMVTGSQSAFIEYLEGTKSIDTIKKLAPNHSQSNQLKEYFLANFGGEVSTNYFKAIQKFVSSLVGYSLVTYLLQVKDRHNANILIDAEGHLIHIDFGFLLGESPGHNINFESSPFKFTREYLELMNGFDSDFFQQFQDLFLKGFKALRRHAHEIETIVHYFYGEDKSGKILDGLRARLFLERGDEDPSLNGSILSLVEQSFDNFRTRAYDAFQQKTNNIAY